MLSIAVLTIFSIMIFMFATTFAAHRLLFPHEPVIEVAKFPMVTVVAQLLAYFVVLGFMVALVKRAPQPFGAAIRWNWPQNWLIYLFGGVVLSLGLQAFAHVLPMPKELPIDRFFQTAPEAWALSIFGTTLAPLFEEFFFRGFLYPTLERWLAIIFATPMLARQAAGLLVVVGIWGCLINRLAKGGVVLLGVAGLTTVILLFLRFIGGWISDGFLQAGLLFCTWGLLARALPVKHFSIASALLLVAVVALAKTGFSSAAPSVRQGLSIAAAIILTALAFGLIHAPQLGRAWGPVLVVFVVGLALTITRAVTKSVAAGLLIHVAYNTTISVLIYMATDGFRHLEKLNQ